jgi:choline dehydrogenase
VRANLKVISGAQAHRLIIERKTAVGVEFSNGPGKPVQNIYAKREVLVCGGAFQSPHLLLLSGIGPAAELQKMGVPVEHDSPQIGKNLQDHLDVCIIYEMTKPLSMYSKTKGLRQPLIGLQYLFTKQGQGRTNHLHAGAFLKTRGELDRPDIQLHLVNACMQDHARIKADRDGFTIHACQLRPESRGTVGLLSRNPFDPPAIDPRYLAEETDRRTMRDSVRIVRDIVSQAALDLYRGAEFKPGDHIRTDSEIDAWIRQNAETIYHPVGTVRMGVDDKAPVDAELRVRGIDCLRVIDASVMPTLIGGNTNAPTIMIAEKLADMIAGKPPLPAQDAPIAEDERMAV